jgi:hypothetical protein
MSATLYDLLQEFKDPTIQYALCLHCQPSDLSNQEHAEFIRAVFHILITERERHMLIPVYAVYWENIFKDLPANIFVPEIPGNYVDVVKAKYAERIKNEEKRRQAFITAKYKERELVRVRDKANQWHLSRVIKVYSYNGKNVYFVEFLEFADSFNEVIIDPLRIKKYVEHKIHQRFSRAVNQPTLNAKLTAD